MAHKCARIDRHENYMDYAELDTKKLQSELHKRSKADRIKKFYELILTDINKFVKNEDERDTLIERLNHYISRRASIEEIAMVMDGLMQSKQLKIVERPDRNLNMSELEINVDSMHEPPDFPMIDNNLRSSSAMNSSMGFKKRKIRKISMNMQRKSVQ